MTSTRHCSHTHSNKSITIRKVHTRHLFTSCYKLYMNIVRDFIFEIGLIFFRSTQSFCVHRLFEYSLKFLSKVILKLYHICTYVRHQKKKYEKTAILFDCLKRQKWRATRATLFHDIKSKHLHFYRQNQLF